MIPLLVDVERVIDGEVMVRCSYLTIESDEPMIGWTLSLANQSFPILLLNLEAIIVGPPDEDKQAFLNPMDIDRMYEQIENVEGMFVDINEIWIPRGWFNMPPKQGQVYRIDQKHFNQCWKFRNDRISMDSFKDVIALVQASEEILLDYIEEESSAFGNWVEAQIELSRKNYQQSEDKLKKRDRGLNM